MKIYTKTGDDGQTSLYGGQRVSKDAARVQTYGTLDECNAVLGVALTHTEDAEIRVVLDAAPGRAVRAGRGPGGPAGAWGDGAPHPAGGDGPHRGRD